MSVLRVHARQVRDNLIFPIGIGHEFSFRFLILVEIRQLK